MARLDKLLLTLVTGGAAAYATMLGAGNATAQTIAPGIELTEACTLSNDERERIDTAATGQVAAMKPIGEARTLKDRLTFKSPEPGIDLGDLSFSNEAGETVTLGSLGSGPKLLNLWATWCAPCRAEMPLLDELRQQSNGAYEVVALSVDAGDMTKSRAFLDEIGVDLPLYHDGTMRTFTGLRGAEIAVGLPVTVLVGRDGCVLAAMNGPAEWASPDARALMDAAVAMGR